MIPLDSLRAGQRVPAGNGFATVLPDFDVETYSEAGYTYDSAAGKWRPINKSSPYGLGAVGAAVYAEHPSTELLSLAYDLKDGNGARLWMPGCPDPADLFNHVRAGGLLEAQNDMFEYWIWLHVCHRRMGWPAIPLEQLRDSMAKYMAHSVPGALEHASKVLGGEQKDPGGKRLITKFCKPRHPTKKNPLTRNYPHLDPVDGPLLYSYNIQDIKAEADGSRRVPDLSPFELEVLKCDHRINARGVSIDVEALEACISIVRQADAAYTAELQALTAGAVGGVGELDALKAWLLVQGVYTATLDKAQVVVLLASDLSGPARRALEIRQILGSSSVAKLFAIERRLSAEGKLHGLFAYYGADRTGRFAGRGPQPQNLPASGPEIRKCRRCARLHRADLERCPVCSSVSDPTDWSHEAVTQALAVIHTGSLRVVEQRFGDALDTVAGCLRGLFVAPEGYDLICSDYSAIEAVVIAELAGEQWRREVFRTHGKIYEMSAAKITGIPFEDFAKYKAEHGGNNHPMRKKIGKVAELASGYQGWIGAWKAFGAGSHFEATPEDVAGGEYTWAIGAAQRRDANVDPLEVIRDRKIAAAVLAWREASPAIVEFWGGQVRKGAGRTFTPELYGLEGAAVSAIQNPGQCYEYRGISYGVLDSVLYCRLPSGRCLTYHEPLLTAGTDRFSRLPVWKISYMGWNTDYKKGPRSWMRLGTYGGKLAENVTQAVARDILVYAMVNAERRSYPIVLHVHDEMATLRRHGEGSVEELEGIMGELPPWCSDWPVRAAGGWRGRRYRKD